MKLAVWLQRNDLIPAEFANKIGVSPSLVHKYLYEDAIPRPKLMQVIYERTHGAVTANDFYDLHIKSRLLISENQNKDRS